MKKTYVVVGTGARALHMFIGPMQETYSEYCSLLGLYDINIGRAREASKRTGIPVFEDFEDMIRKTKPDIVVVTTVDAFHSDYIIRSMEMGCDVITEKPMTIDAAQCRAILDAEKRTGRKIRVTFNYRFTPFTTKIKELISSGVIGDIFSVHFEWMLDRNMDILAHGTSYFRRWNARLANSGGLLVHKSTHHFDCINWWLEQRPVNVSAFGRLNLYGTNGSKKYAGGISGRNCRNCEHASECEFYYKLTEDEKSLYADNEQYDGYYKDGCVYAQDIDIYDTMSVIVEYDKGTLLTYSLNATCAYEGWRVAMNGSKGRLELFLPQTGPDEPGTFDTVRVFDLNNNVTEYRVTRVEGDHGGGDERLRKMLFVGGVPDSLGHLAGTEDGAASVLVGAAANVSIKEKRTVNIRELMECSI